MDGGRRIVPPASSAVSPARSLVAPQKSSTEEVMLRIRIFAMIALALALSAGLAAACPEVQVAFDPAQAGPGDTVHFFSRLANTGTDPITANLEITLTFGDHTVGPFSRPVPLGAGFDHSTEFDFVIPPFAMPG